MGIKNLLNTEISSMTNSEIYKNIIIIFNLLIDRLIKAMTWDEVFTKYNINSKEKEKVIKDIVQSVERFISKDA